MQPIESTKNDIVKLLRSLDSAKGRLESNLLLAEGEKLVADALAAGWAIPICLYDPTRYEALAYQINLAGGRAYPAKEAVIKSVSTLAEPQGIVAAVAQQTFAKLDGSPLLVLDGVQDPGNVGTMLRTAEAAGFQGVILGSGTADRFSPKVVRGSMGSVFRLATVMTERLADDLADYVQNDWSVYATTMQGEDFFTREPTHGKRMLVIGSEGKGLSEAVLSVCNKKLTLPMAGKTQSLNAAVAAGIMMFDWYKEGERL